MSSYVCLFSTKIGNSLSTTEYNMQLSVHEQYLWGNSGAVSPARVEHRDSRAGSVDERPSPPSFEPTRETRTRRRRRCTSEGVRSAFVSCGCDPSSTGSPARRSDRGVPFWGGLAQQNTVQSSEHLIKFHPFKWSTMRMRTAQNIAAYFRVLVHNPGWSWTRRNVKANHWRRVTQ